MWQQQNAWGQPWPPIQQSAYANMPHDQVDWAALAKQWMQYKDVNDQPIQAPNGDSMRVMQGWGGQQPLLPDPPHHQELTRHQDSQDWSQGNHNWSHGNTHESYEPYSQHTSQVTDFSHSGSETYAPPVEGYPPPDPTYNAGYAYDSQVYQASVGSTQPWEPLPAFQHSPAAITPHHTPHAKTPRSSYQADLTSSALLDANKRKQLPVWIREGLEKMEREKQKKEEMERIKLERENAKLKAAEEEKLRAEAEGRPPKSKFEMDSDHSDEEEAPASQTETAEVATPRKRSLSPEQFMSEEEKQAALLMKVKAMMTEVLLSVTNQEIGALCQEVYSKLKKRKQKAPAKLLAKSNALASLTSSFGGYDDSDEEEGSTSSSSGDSDNNSDSSSTEDEKEARRRLSKRREEFSRRQGERLRQLEEEEKQAMDYFNNPVQEGYHFEKKTDIIPGLDLNEQSAEIGTQKSPDRSELNTNQKRISSEKINARTGSQGFQVTPQLPTVTGRQDSEFGKSPRGGSEEKHEAKTVDSRSHDHKLKSSSSSGNRGRDMDDERGSTSSVESRKRDSVSPLVSPRSLKLEKSSPASRKVKHTSSEVKVRESGSQERRSSEEKKRDHSSRQRKEKRQFSEERKRSRSRHRKRSRSRDRKRSRSRDRKRSHSRERKSHLRSRDRKRSQTRERKRSHSREKKRSRSKDRKYQRSHREGGKRSSSLEKHQSDSRDRRRSRSRDRKGHSESKRGRLSHDRDSSETNSRDSVDSQSTAPNKENSHKHLTAAFESKPKSPRASSRKRRRSSSRDISHHRSSKHSKRRSQDSEGEGSTSEAAQSEALSRSQTDDSDESSSESGQQSGKTEPSKSGR